MCKVEVLDASSTPVAGYTLADADERDGNRVERAVTWNGKCDVAALQNRPIRLRFVMRAAKLYAFQFQP